ncbi:hypothetical protein PN499_07120 [Kamptonema animale CS-326]|jgi:hypothetical protein|uniref:hypothetical protein n=1 Tax=Kamptonema animale TaxID=92934 RepID=UPI00232FF0F7|nr:hypothetical protein [Kamptonema animale]MDB9510948.1 hypothetical protein [Kamptonema animale CS-326]
MQRISDIDVLDLGRESLSQEEREKLRQEKYQQERDNGYQQLAELCYLGEYGAAKQLANRNQKWGYEIVDGMVMERID